MKKECNHEKCESCDMCHECNKDWKNCKYWMKRHGHGHHHGGCGGFYFLGFIGSAVFFMSKAVGFWASILALLKAMVWPAFMVYELFKFLIK